MLCFRQVAWLRYRIKTTGFSPFHSYNCKISYRAPISTTLNNSSKLSILKGLKYHTNSLRSIMPRPSRKGRGQTLTNGVQDVPQAETARRRPVRTASTKTVNYIVDAPSPSDPEILDAETDLRASPTAEGDVVLSPEFVPEHVHEPEEPLPPSKGSARKKSAGKGNAAKPAKAANGTEIDTPLPKKSTSKKRKADEVSAADQDFEPGVEADEGEDIDDGAERPPAVNHDYRPLPFKGRIGFACLNTYLRTSNPPIFCSRTCRIDTILKHDNESGPGAGMKYVKSLGYANASDLSKLIRWNQKYGIKFLRISSEMFPFASHGQYGYTLEHAADPLKEAGRLAMEYGHRLTMHPGQFTQLGSPRKEVVEAAIKDLQYHCELIDRLQLKGQADKDAVMIIHMGGIFGDKSATLDRFRDVYTTRLSDGIKRRLVLENDDVCYSVEDLLPICQELSIPLVLDWHHNNIIHGNLREGTYDVREKLGDAIKKTWTDKGIKQKQHYSEPREGSVTNKERRRHSARVVDFPPCEDTMDLMIEAKDKEQSVFELMRKFKVDGWEKINDVIPYERTDENKEVKRKKKGEEEVPVVLVPEEEIGMGGSENRVYWPEKMDEYLKPKKRVRAKKEEVDEGEINGEATPKKASKKNDKTSKIKEEKPEVPSPAKKSTKMAKSKEELTTTPTTKKAKKSKNTVITETENISMDVQPKPTATAKSKSKGTEKSKTAKRIPLIEAVAVTEIELDTGGRRRSARGKK